MGVERLKMLAEQLVSGEVSLREIDANKELAVIGLESVIQQAEYLAELRRLAGMSNPAHLPGDPRTQQIVWTLNAHPEMVGPVVDFIAGLLESEDSPDVS